MKLLYKDQFLITIGFVSLKGITMSINRDL